MWSIRPVVENAIHIPDMGADNFHCLAKKSFHSPPPEPYVQNGVLHPTIQFSDVDFFRYPFVHVKAQWADRDSHNVLWDALYKVPPKTSLANMKPGAGFTLSSLGWNAELVKNYLKPGGVDYVHMKKICIPPNGVKHRLLVTVNATDSAGVEVAAGPAGMGVYSVKHFFGLGDKLFLDQLNKGVTFL
jgi:hypothetical protein